MVRHPGFASWVIKVLRALLPFLQTNFRSSEALLRPLPTPGLVELHLLFSIPSATGPAEHESVMAIRDCLVEFTHRVSAVAPSLILTCRFIEDRGWQWSDLGKLPNFAMQQR